MAAWVGVRMAALDFVCMGGGALLAPRVVRGSICWHTVCSTLSTPCPSHATVHCPPPPSPLSPPPQITPLFLAAQKGHTKVCKLLVENGANPNQPSYIEGTTELCTPAEVWGRCGSVDKVWKPVSIPASPVT